MHLPPLVRVLPQQDHLPAPPLLVPSVVVRDVSYYCDLFLKHFHQVPENTGLWGSQAEPAPCKLLQSPTGALPGFPKAAPHTLPLLTPLTCSQPKMDLLTPGSIPTFQLQDSFQLALGTGPSLPDVTLLVSWRGFPSTFLTPAVYIPPLFFKTASSSQCEDGAIARSFTLLFPRIRSPDHLPLIS